MKAGFCLSLKKNVRLRLFVRDKVKASAIVADKKDVEIFQCDLLSGKGLKEALHGIHSDYYLVHSMAGKSVFRNIEYAGPGLQVSIKMEKIRLGISSCLLGEKVRYHGGHKLDHYLKETLGRYVDWVPVCPEASGSTPSLPAPFSGSLMIWSSLLTKQQRSSMSGPHPEWAILTSA